MYSYSQYSGHQAQYIVGTMASIEDTKAISLQYHSAWVHFDLQQQKVQEIYTQVHNCHLHWLTIVISALHKLLLYFVSTLMQKYTEMIRCLRLFLKAVQGNKLNAPVCISLW